MTQKFDLVVIGTGEAGSTIAKECRAEGWEVAIIDAKPFGGTCALRGCTPKKVLVNAAALYEQNHRFQGKGLDVLPQLDWQQLIQFKHSFTDPVPDKREEQYKEAGIVMFHGWAEFVDQATVCVDGQNLSGRYIVIATGSKPATLGITGEEYLTTSDEFLNLEQLPQRIIFVGGGYISFEFAHAAVRAGAQVQILHEGDRPLEHFDPDLVDQLVATSRDAGIDIQLNTAVKAIVKDGDQFIVHGSNNNQEQTYTADLVVHGASRMPQLEELNLECGEVKRDQYGVCVNEFLQSISNPAVYAAGDVAGGSKPQLTPIASMEAHVVASNLLQGNHRQPDYSEVASVVFTVPRLTMVGMTEEVAEKQGLEFDVHYHDTSDWLFSRQLGVKRSSTKVLTEVGSNRILGAHLFGPHAEEVINVFATAIRAQLTSDDLKSMIYAYPTGASQITHMLK